MLEKYGWRLIALCVLAGTLLHLVGYNYGLPYFEEGDEGRLFTNAFASRRGDEFGLGVDLTGYPPLIMDVHRLLQPMAEQVTGRPALLDAGVTVGYIRLLLVLLDGLIGAMLAWSAGRMAGKAAALLAVCAWFIIPGVLQTTVVALTEGFQIFFYVLSLTLAVYTLDRRIRIAGVLAVVAGLFAMLAKYSALPALGFGVGAVCWLIWCDNRRKWAIVLLIQALMIAAAAVYFAPLVYGLSHSSHPEAASFATGQNFARFIDIGAQWQTIVGASLQISLAPALFVALVIAASVLYARRWRDWRAAVWGMLVIIVAAHLLLIVGYILFYGILFRYVAPALGMMILLVALASHEIGVWLAARTGKTWFSSGVPLVLGLLWLIPAVPPMLELVYNHTLPDTRAALGEWSLNILTTDNNLILADSVSSGRVFTRDFGGYRGKWQTFFEQDFGAQPVQYWRDKGYSYAVGTPDFFESAFARQPDAESQILLLNEFPPPNSTQAWRGQPLRFYRLRGMQHNRGETLGDAIVLAGYDLQQTSDTLIVTPYWRATKLPDANYNVYLHLAPLDSRDMIAQADGIPAPNRLTRTWYDPAETLIGTTFTVPLPPDATGEYRLLIGMYNLETGARLPAANGDDYIELERITLGG